MHPKFMAIAFGFRFFSPLVANTAFFGLFKATAKSGLNQVFFFFLLPNVRFIINREHQ